MYFTTIITYLMINFHVLACSATSRFDITVHISRRLCITVKERVIKTAGIISSDESSYKTVITMHKAGGTLAGKVRACTHMPSQSYTMSKLETTNQTNYMPLGCGRRPTQHRGSVRRVRCRPLTLMVWGNKIPKVVRAPSFVSPNPPMTISEISSSEILFSTAVLSSSSIRPFWRVYASLNRPWRRSATTDSRPQYTASLSCKTEENKEKLGFGNESVDICCMQCCEIHCRCWIWSCWFLAGREPYLTVLKGVLQKLQNARR